VAHDGAVVDAEEIRTFLTGRIASYKIPRQVLFFAADELSYTANNKIRSDQLRALAIARLGPDESA